MSLYTKKKKKKNLKQGYDPIANLVKSHRTTKIKEVER
jgi:hypothetical protein